MYKENNNFSNLEKAILRVLAFFDIFDYPLTLVEIHKWLYLPDKPYSLYDINQALESDNLTNRISVKKGFYFFAGRESIIKIRLDRYQIAEKKFKIALKTIFWLRWLAFIKMIGICNNAGYNNASSHSDIDFFIVVRKGRLWWSRLLITLVTTFLGIRRHDKKVVDRVCLSFYVADDHLNLTDISLPPTDPYLVYWVATLMPIYDQGVYKNFLQANSWLDLYLPNFYDTTLNSRRQIKDSQYTKFSKGVDRKVLAGTVGNLLEFFAKILQIGRVKKYLGSSLDKNNTNVIVNTSMLKFHKIDRRDYYRSIWQKKLNDLEIV
ncbi:MAG: hypothetical protein CMI53_04390 [Parcubacteria group bacterium]|jgi:hypothetical protein|nr:hypothetical protein [Parcubacteria group bacterium]|tara:strand:- start:7539 stop:8501 length:963 start_codon:yes stop_codon:yes gene_type:complete